MTGLLVSVRSAAEARLACEQGVDLLDVKEPQGGSLGAAAMEVVQDVLAVAGQSVPMSVALGELVEWKPTQRWPEGIQYAKLGLAGAKRLGDWKSRWRDALSQFPASVRPVAVAYADWQEVEAPSIDEVIGQAVEQNCAAVLIDTSQKNGRTLLDYCSPEELRRYVHHLRQGEMKLVLAGSLRLEHIETLLPLEPNYLGVRGAVCSGGRTGGLAPEKLQLWLSRLRAGVPK